MNTELTIEQIKEHQKNIAEMVAKSLGLYLAGNNITSVELFNEENHKRLNNTHYSLQTGGIAIDVYCKTDEDYKDYVKKYGNVCFRIDIGKQS